jgi:hypothetical protein
MTLKQAIKAACKVVGERDFASDHTDISRLATAILIAGKLEDIKLEIRAIGFGVHDMKNQMAREERIR